MTTNQRPKVVASIDDDSFFQDWVKARCAAAGYECLCYQDPFDFLCQLHKGQHYDVVICDRFGAGFDSVADGIAASCRNLGYEGLLILCSCSVNNAQQTPGFDISVSKLQVTSARFNAWLQHEPLPTQQVGSPCEA